MTRLRIASLVAALALGASTAWAITWEIDPAHSSINFTIRHLMITNVKGSFNQYSGTIDFDGKDPSTASVETTIRTSSIDTGIEARDNHLRNADFFDVEKYPTITFKSTKVTPTGDKAAKIQGDLTIRGITKPVTIDAEMLGTVQDPKFGTRAGFTGSTTISRKDYGLTWNKALEAGGVAVGDEVKINLEIEAIEKKDDPSKAVQVEKQPAKPGEKTQ